MFKYLGDKKLFMLVLEDIFVVYDYWFVVCLLLYFGNIFYYIKKIYFI